MNGAERRALAALTFDLAPRPDDVWRRPRFHVDGLHQEAVQKIMTELDSVRSREQASPTGVVMQGPSGSGKTHLLGMVREHVLHQNVGYFFLVSLLNGKEFWQSTALSVVEGLLRDAETWGTQLKAFLRRLTPMLGLPSDIRDAVCGDANLNKGDLDLFISGLRDYNRSVGQMAQHTARALVLFGASDHALQDIALSYLSSADGNETSEWAEWGLGGASRSPQLIVRDISRLLALTGPTVIAIDQIDTLFADVLGGMLHIDRLSPEQRAVVGLVADGVMMMREHTRRTLIVVSCLPDVWELLAGVAAPLKPRFRRTSYLTRVHDPEIARKIVAKRFEVGYNDARFPAPYPTWPIKTEAFANAGEFLVRDLLVAVQNHITFCLDHDRVVELDQLDSTTDISAPPGDPREPKEKDLIALDGQFAEFVRRADVGAALDPKREDTEMAALLGAGLASWIDELSDHQHEYKHDPLPGAKPALHARLRRILNKATEDEAHWAIRGVSSRQANAVITRIHSASTMAGLSRDAPKRHVVLLRNTGWALGPKTIQAVNAFRSKGGLTWEISTDDLKVFAALREMRGKPHPALRAWLRSRTPATRSTFLTDLLGDAAAPSNLGGVTPVGPAPSEPASPDEVLVPSESNAAVQGTVIQLGANVDGGDRLTIDVEALRKHVAIFAGSGSGKTVLIRRLIEECALQGISAIVLDPNNDLARLGDPWPEPPRGWQTGDVERAARYFDSSEVVVWTPRRESGRPLTFQPLPDFASVRDDPDEFGAAIDAAVAALAPRVRLDGATVKAELGQAVLKEALLYHSRSPATGLHSFIDLLANLPEGVSALTRGERIAAEMAETLRAATVNDPLFGGRSPAVDPGVLLTPRPGKRARISVISFVGLHSDAQRQGFVNQLQMALFAWIKQNPAGDRPLGGLFVMDEAQTLAPSGPMTACTASSIALASQARKYGLGLVFATQAPRALHNRITGNAATQFYGLLGHPTQIQAAKELARAKGGEIPDIGVLGQGQFYAAPDAGKFRKVRTPLCLSFHPSSPLTPEEVMERARTG